MLLLMRTMRGGNPVAPSVVAPTLSSPTMGETTASVTFTGGSGYTTLIPQYSLNGTDWTSISNDTSSPFSFTGLTADTLYYFRALPDNNVSYASNTVSGTTDEASGSALFSDSFESGDFTHTENGVSWGGAVDDTTVQAVNPVTGTRSARFRFPATAGTDSSAELNFDFGKQVTEISLRYHLLLPSNYNHTSGNKKGIVQMWSGAYGAATDGCYIGWEFWPNADHGQPDGGSILASRRGRDGVDLGNYYGPPDSRIGSMFDVADKGKWHQFRVHHKMASGPGMTDGFIRAWKYVEGGSPELLWDEEWGYSSTGNYLEKGYILGWANGGFAAQTDFFVDDVAFVEDGLVDWGDW